MRLRLDGATRNAPVRVGATLPGVVHLLMGNDPTQWRTNLPTYAGITYANVYPGIDLSYDGTDGQLKRTFVVSAGADPSRIRWRYQGAGVVSVDAAGLLHITLPTLGNSKRPPRELVEGPLVVWQIRTGQHVPVSARYVLNADNSVGVALDAYDAALPLWIDPVLAYNVSLGSGGADRGFGVATDAAGRTYVTGEAAGADFPRSGGQAFGGASDAFIIKLMPDGQSVEWSAFVGGSGGDTGQSIVVDAAGRVSIAGITSSTNLPMVNAQQAGYGGGSSDGFAATVSANGRQLVHSTYIGGSGLEYTYDIAAAPGDASAVYVVGLTGSSNFPTTSGAYQATCQACATGGADAYVTKVSTTSNARSYATFLGGTLGGTQGHTIAVDSAGSAYVAGQTLASNFPVSAGAADTSFGGGQWDAFVFKLNPQGTGRVYATFVGGNGADCEVSGDTRDCAIAVDSTGAAYLAGTTTSTTLPTTAGAYQSASGGGTSDMFVAKLTPQGTAFSYLTYLGGSGTDRGRGLVIDTAGNATIVGDTTGGYPVLQPIQANYGGTIDAVATQLNASGSAVLWSTYLGTTATEVVADAALGRRNAIALVGTVNIGSQPGDAFVAQIGDAANGLPGDQVFCPLCHPAHISVGGPIDTRTGNLWTSAVDLAIASDGPTLVWQRAYASQSTGDPAGPLGSGWTHPYATRVVTPTSEASVVIVVSPSGNRERFRDTGNGSYTAFPGIFSRLEGLSGGGYRLTQRDQSILTFAANGALQGIRDPRGRTLVLDYTGTPARLNRVRDANDASRSFQLSYTAAGFIETVSDGTRTVTYGYTGTDLTTLTDVRQQPTTYQYQSHLLTGITNALGQPVERTLYDVYSPTGRAIQQTLHDGQRLDLTTSPRRRRSRPRRWANRMCSKYSTMRREP